MNKMDFVSLRMRLLSLHEEANIPLNPGVNADFWTIDYYIQI